MLRPKRSCFKKQVVFLIKLIWFPRIFSTGVYIGYIILYDLIHAKCSLLSHSTDVMLYTLPSLLYMQRDY